MTGAGPAEGRTTGGGTAGDGGNSADTGREANHGDSAERGTLDARSDLIALADAARHGRLPHTDETWRRLWIDPATARPAAVLILFGALDDIPSHASSSTAQRVPDDLDVLLIERAGGLQAHPGQVSFPGGGIDAGDQGPEEAALREAVEETGLDPSGVEILGTLPQAGLPVSNFLVTPVLGWWRSPSPVAVVDFAESAQVFRVPVRDLLDPANRRTAVVTREGSTFRSPAFPVNGVIVWGFTAMVLSQVFDQLGWTIEWDSTHEIPAPL